ncbi:NAD(P)-dependent oxidoreductase [Cryptosporangium aurantiacum]|uniref:3-hydroxyisobutyrate dehydrogenase n=1 Tax=Cryptosporangium aurantiacum TaxID=134849 RepID=A0A1M7TYM8_9ACTN|nr:NAD(P)-dependent oxidoreductase [Cryptosporangium aurantiacum]SHN75785.1 3-hydroxyisobutyrate dehydrogenase [Cryptosporangium aurantiacum]
MTGPVGFVGLGAIGAPMARRLLEWPGGLHVYDVAPKPLAEFARAGATVAASVADLAAAASVVCVMVRDDEQVRDVLDEILGSVADGLVVAIHSTVAPDTPAQLAKRAAERGVTVIDAPVSGSTIGAAAGTLAIMVGGSAEGFAAAEPVLATMGTRVVHAGPIGAGTRMKLARNLVHFVSFTAVAEAQRLAEAAGIDLVDLGAVVRHTDAITGGPGAIMHRDSTAQLLPGDPWTGIFEHVRTLGEKDLGLAVELADSLGVETPLARYALTHLGRALSLPEDTP